MPEAQTKEDTLRDINAHVRAIKGELAAVEVRAHDRYIAIGEHLTELRKLVPTGSWIRFIRDNFDFTDASANRYMKFYREVRANRRPSKLSDVETPRQNHQPRDFNAFRSTVHQARENIRQASQRHAPEPETGRRSPQSHKAFVRQLAQEIVTTGYKILAQKHHPDRGGANADMAALTEARDMLVRLLRRLS